MATMLDFLDQPGERKVRITFPKSILNISMGILLVGILSIFFLLKETPSVSFWLVVFLLFLVWFIWTLKNFALSFFITLFIWITLYSRTTMPFFAFEGPGNRGGVALGDFLWIGLMFAMSLFILLNKQKITISNKFWGLSIFIWLYPLFVVLLPVLGLLTGRWPFSFVTPALRQIQWASFALLGYLLAKRYEYKIIIRYLIKTVFVSAIVHLIYSLVQIGASFKIIPDFYLFLDQLFKNRFQISWFFYPRATGLFVNPNSYGVFCAMVLILAISIIISGYKLNRIEKILFFATSIGGMLLSGSRSGVLGFFITLLLLGFAFIFMNKGDIKRTLHFSFTVLILAIVFIPGIWLLLPEILKNRFFLLFQTVSEGVAVDPNAIGRVLMWKEAITEQLRNYPFGTLVPPSYALNSAIDSYYVTTLVQGTIIFTILFLLFMISVTNLGVTLIKKAKLECKLIGSTLIGFVGVIAGASFTLSPILQPQVIALFWSVLGFGFALRRYKEEYHSEL